MLAGRLAWSVGGVAGVGLFSRVRRDEVLQQQTRSRIYEVVEAEPGIHYAAIRLRLGIGNGTLAHHLHTLEREGFVTRQRQGRRVRFHAHERPARPLNRAQADILRFVTANPECTRADLADAYGVTRQTVHHHVRRLVVAGLLEEGNGLTAHQANLGACPRCDGVYDHRDSEPVCPTCRVDLDRLQGPVVSYRRAPTTR